jgi:hypothetical protein
MKVGAAYPNAANPDQHFIGRTGRPGALLGQQLAGFGTDDG